ncbi:MAG TPA: hypothetical protein VFF73_09835 [Planctomycetota bacterium]|nr:hypothetical protein [Planctomycetota bacterium]
MTCPEMPDLLDHMEGRADLTSHLVECRTCATAFADLRSALSTEAALVATPELDVERALESVKARSRKAERVRWGASFFFTAAAAAVLVVLLPSHFQSGAGPGPAGGSSDTAVMNGFPGGVEAPGNFRITDPNVTSLISGTAALHS